MNKTILKCTNLTKHFPQANAGILEIFNQINLEIMSGQSLSIVGSSGSGKTSLLQILAGLERATHGQVIICDQLIHNLSSNEMCRLRNQKLGFIYQFHHLLPEFTARENTLMPLIISGNITAEQEQYAEYILERLGLSKRLEHYPNQLSGGERQRVAIARAVVNNPQIIFADEPTGNLDNATAHQVLDVLLQLQQELNTSLIIVTHDYEIAKRTQFNYRLHEGKLNLLATSDSP